MNSSSTVTGAAGGRPHLIDSSIWIPVLRPGKLGQALAPLVTTLLTAGVAAITEVILMEVLRGAHDAAEYQRLQARLAPLTLLPVTAERWKEAAHLGFILRRQHGITAASTDLLIAAVAMAHGATLVHRDGDFDLIAKHVPLVVESHV
jgi:predicted nucleic acid-binding protein